MKFLRGISAERDFVSHMKDSTCYFKCLVVGISFMMFFNYNFLIYEMKNGGIVIILSDLLRLCFIHNILTLLAVRLVPPFENGKT
jgi:hypothetical protein